MSCWLIAYDVISDSARAALVRRLEKAGRRLQKSVFLVEKTNIAALQRELEACLGPADSLLLLPVCGQCAKKALLFGPVPPLLLIS